MKVADTIQLDVDTVQNLHPTAKNIIIQLDNATSFSSQ